MEKQTGTDFDTREQKAVKAAAGGRRGRRRALTNELLSKGQSFSRVGLGWNSPFCQAVENFVGSK